MTPAFRVTLIWIVGSMLAFVVAMNYLPASLVDGHYIPVSNDSFYHARRILDIAAHPGELYQFDSHINFPTGSWIVWPWGYDYLMAQIVRVSVWMSGSTEPMKVLAYIPVFALGITIALVLAVASLLRLSMGMRALVVLCFGVTPLTQGLHGVGAVDHHFAEHMFIVASLAAGLAWLRRPQSLARAVLLALVLATSVGIHNGLFVLQFPLMLAIGITWLRGDSPDRRAALAFGATLFVVTLLVALPSHATRIGGFEFYLLSWFHVYVAGCSALVTILMSRLPHGGRRNLGIVAALCAALMIPIALQAILGGGFITGQLDVLQGIDEIQSPVKLAFSAAGAKRISQLYGYFVWLTPLLFVACVFYLFRERRPEYLLFWVFSTFTLFLLSMQLRFYYYGSVALYVIPFLLMDNLRTQWPGHRHWVLAGSSALGLGALVPSMLMHLNSRAAPGLDPIYAQMRYIYPVLAEACRKRPGVVLANPDQGHYIRYHTDCSVISNNFRLTQQHADSIAWEAHLETVTPEKLMEEAPGVTYVLALILGPFTTIENGDLKPTDPALLRQLNGTLAQALLLGDPSRLPARFRSVAEIRFSSTLPEVPYPMVRLYEILPEASAAIAPESPAPISK